MLYSLAKQWLQALGYEVKDCGDVQVPVRDTLPEEGALAT